MEDRLAVRSEGWELGRARLLLAAGTRSRVDLVLRGTSRAEAELRCPHVPLMRPRMPRAVVCERCVARQASWSGLLVCSSCGSVGCCDRSKHRHAERHFRETGHPVVEMPSLERSSWTCLVDHIRVFA
jgi:hypothetical protein